MTDAPVWAWPENATTPLRVGVLRRDDATGIGEFQYDADYLAAGGPALDPGQLRHRDARHPIKVPAAAREGVPGIIADAGPDTWGRRILAQDLGFEPNALEALVHSADDGVGHLSVGDLGAKPAINRLDLEALADAIQRRQEGLPHKANRAIDLVLSPDTALGGAKPKATTLIDNFPWIAKFPERGDPLHLPYFEAAALRLAAFVGIESAQTDVHPLPQGRSVLLVKRFDRLPDGSRIPMASALTVLGPAAQALGPERTYLKLAHALRKWSREEPPYPSGGQLWERITFNGLVGNTDDHPRNHALLKDEGHWQLSPMFDVVPTFFPRDKVALAMPFLAETPTRLSAAVSAVNLVRAGPSFGVPVEEALPRLIHMATQVVARLPEVLTDLHAPAAVGVQLQPMLAWTCKILADARGLTQTDVQPAKPKRRGWHWAP